MDQLYVVLTTAPDEACARDLAKTLVAERLAACVNVLPAVASYYIWEGAEEEGSEVLMVAKIRGGDFDAYAERLDMLHPYDVPEIVALPAERVSEAYHGWCVAQTERVTGPGS